MNAQATKPMRSDFAPIAAISAAIALGGFAGLAVPANAQSGTLSVTDLTGGLTPMDLANALLAPTPGLVITNVTYGTQSSNGSNGEVVGSFEASAPTAAGLFTTTGGTVFTDGVNSVTSGVVLTSGAATNILGPNSSGATSQQNSLGGDTALDSLLPPGQTTYDQCVLTIDFTVSDPALNRLRFDYVFGSEEYNEWVGSYNDVFGFFVNGTNAALIPGTSTPVSINNVNYGDPSPAEVSLPPQAPSNPQYYINNDPYNAAYDPSTGFTTPYTLASAPYNTQLDGFTKVLSVYADIHTGANTLTLAIADTRDNVYDSAVMIQAGSLEAVEDTAPEPGSLALAAGAALPVVGTLVLRRRRSRRSA